MRSYRREGEKRQKRTKGGKACGRKKIERVKKGKGEVSEKKKKGKERGNSRSSNGRLFPFTTKLR